MKPSLFEYAAPRKLDEAVALLAGDPSAMVLAGGQSLVPALNLRLAAPGRLVDIQHVEGLHALSVANGWISVGAMVRHRTLELSPEVQRANPLIRAAMAHVAHIPIRTRGTVVGSLCHADAAAEMPMLLVLMDGSVVAQGPQGRREIAADAFFQFHLTTARAPDEIVVEARFPVLPPGTGWAFEEFARRRGDYALAAVGALIRRRRGGPHAVALAACGIASRPVRLRLAEKILAENDFSEAALHAAAEAARDSVTAPDDAHATTAYRRHLLAGLLRRAVAAALSRAQ
ncbi:FAD binding domain-containing protein [Methylobacterium dankookense]|uniref:6-hydroxypseudooxynicotine dehydrogenase complex subunit alpha n=1 Tax=Methylobacterium dankookense TaxID=560405 RepID=A0A564G2N2_9HYPH|nr:FAD binding domain-containing protein [Methylobacterium dankookense]GJD54783.1 6-hydroxypseudooxynicotine dehydrogenase complex subunit alpha [Methylobacterium dankookense]VUF14256.1 6-hydroxypseudooxynicotine dehydrogenase complex subunit alpha [Methylobacterium dankookense]